MSRRILLSGWVIAAGLAMTLPCAWASGQSYGTNDQLLTIGVGSMADRNGHAGYLQADGYAYFLPPSDEFLAPLPLPEGARLGQLCFYVNDHNAGPSQSAEIVAVKLVPGGEGPQIATIPNSFVSSTSHIGYGVYCTGDIGYTLRSQTDIDGDGVADAVVYYAKVVGFNGADPVGLGAIRLTWRRQVSPPPNTPTFGDVPASDSAFAFVESLAASGVTGGCGNGDFCPSATLTRRQMAVFLAKALGLHWSN
jgi:hypothetical protein